ncbi:hypothetical protein ACFL35_00905 [Candidatus Riflebacteria bacterium]
MEYRILILSTIILFFPDVSLFSSEYDVFYNNKKNFKTITRADVEMKFTITIEGKKDKKSKRFQFSADTEYVPEKSGYRVIEKMRERKFWENGKEIDDPNPEQLFKSGSNKVEEFPPNFILKGKKKIKTGAEWNYERKLDVKQLDLLIHCKSKIKFMGLSKFRKKECFKFKETGKIWNKLKPTDKGRLEGFYYMDRKKKVIIFSKVSYAYRSYMNIEFMDMKQEIPLTFKIVSKNYLWEKIK